MEPNAANSVQNARGRELVTDGICPTLACIAGQSALQRTQHITRTFRLFQGKEINVKKCSRDDLMFGQLLGTGGFSNVYEARFRHKHSPEDKNSTLSVVAPSKELEKVESSQKKYAVKLLHPRAMRNKKNIGIGAADLAQEASLLSYLDHDNIIRLYYVTEGCLRAAFESSALECGYFLVLDHLHETLQQRLKTWAECERNYGCAATESDQILESSQSNQSSRLVERLCVIHSVARGMEYLHSNNILFRDLKPNNVGFDMHGSIKIFDFGLATELRMDNEQKLTGRSGSPRYMSPEVAKSKFYDLKADVYSFGIVLWEVCSLNTPFSGMNFQTFQNNVVFGGGRPKMSSKWSWALQSIMSSCWAEMPADRPVFKEVLPKLKSEIMEIGAGSDSTQTNATKGFFQKIALTNEDCIGVLAA